MLELRHSFRDLQSSETCGLSVIDLWSLQRKRERFACCDTKTYSTQPQPPGPPVSVTGTTAKYCGLGTVIIGTDLQSKAERLPLLCSPLSWPLPSAFPTFALRFPDLCPPLSLPLPSAFLAFALRFPDLCPPLSWPLLSAFLAFALRFSWPIVLDLAWRLIQCQGSVDD